MDQASTGAQSGKAWRERERCIPCEEEKGSRVESTHSPVFRTCFCAAICLFVKLNNLFYFIFSAVAQLLLLLAARISWRLKSKSSNSNSSSSIKDNYNTAWPKGKQKAAKCKSLAFVCDSFVAPECATFHLHFICKLFSMLLAFLWAWHGC